MRLKHPLLKLRKQFCADTLAAEVGALPPSAWVPHPGNYTGNDAVPLIAPGGKISNSFTGPMMPTEHLRRCPYIMEIMADIGAVWGRSRLMGLAPGAEVPAHVDVNYYWRTHMRVHIPVITNPAVTFTVGQESVHMEPGECWVFDSFRLHNVQNRGSAKRIHLVLDTVGGEALWDLIEQAEATDSEAPLPPPLERERTAVDALAFEQFNAPGVMSPWEIRCHVAFITEHLAAGPLADAVLRRMDKFAHAWTAVWAHYGPSEQGAPVYRQLIQQVSRDLGAMPGSALTLPNEVPVLRAFDELIFKVALPPAPVRLVQPAFAGRPPSFTRLA